MGESFWHQLLYTQSFFERLQVALREPIRFSSRNFLFRNQSKFSTGKCFGSALLSWFTRSMYVNKQLVPSISLPCGNYALWNRRQLLNVLSLELKYYNTQRNKQSHTQTHTHTHIHTQHVFCRRYIDICE